MYPTKIRIVIKNAQTSETVVDNTVQIDKYDVDIAIANFECFRKTFPDCTVQFIMSNGDYLSSRSYDDMVREEESQIDRLVEEDFVSRDSFSL
jgi:hypothetical protein